MIRMGFLYERRARWFYIFLAALCIVQIGFMGFSGIFQAAGIRRALAERERAAASYLLEQEVPPSLLASAWNQTEVTAEGVLFSAVLLWGAGVFLQRRERLYEEAETVVAKYADGRFDMHLPEGENGAVYRLFGKVEQLALSLQSKSETERHAKEFLRDMISDISHQLKTPLAALDMYMEILAEEPENPDTVRTFSRKSMRSLERMEQLINALLKMARLDTGSIVFEKRPCLAAEIAEQAVGEFSERARQERKEIVMEGRPEECIFCDGEWTKEAVANLVKNALDHTREGGTIRVTWKRSPALLRLTVEDDGCGIAPEDVHHIFKRFYRSRNSSDRQGAGLGLSLAKSIIEGQGGTLFVESSPGEGSAFGIAFPVS